MKAIEVEALTHRYRGGVALEEVSFAVPAGSVYALLGPNGAGKTTMLRILAGLLRPTSGRATLLGRNVAELTAADRMDIGYVAEGQPLPAAMRLRELESYLAPLYDRWDHGLADELRERFRLDPARRVGRMSRGEQMKAALLISLAPRPRLLLMDEPFTGMDVLVKDEIIRGMLGGVAEGETTVLISSHDLVELEPLADYVGFLDDGDLLLSAPMEAVRARFRHVELTARDSASDLYVPAGVMAEEGSGRRVSFIAEDHGGLEGELRTRNTEGTYVDVRDVTLRELFVALAGRGAGR